MFKSMLRATIDHGEEWSSYANWPRQARRYFIFTRLGPLGPSSGGSSRSRVNFGKLCWPPGHFSTSICQSVRSTERIVKVDGCVKTVDQSSAIDSRPAEKKGRSSSLTPPIEKFSIRK